MGTELSGLLNEMTRMICTGIPIDDLGVELTPEIRSAWNRLEEQIAEIQASGRGVAIPVEFEDFGFLKNLNKIPDDQLSIGSAHSDISATTKPPRLLRKSSKCPSCKAGKLIPIVYGLPSHEVMEQSDRGEIELGGCVVTQIIDHNGIRTNDPELHCPTCSSNFYRSGVKDTVPQEIAEQLEEL